MGITIPQKFTFQKKKGSKNIQEKKKTHYNFTQEKINKLINSHYANASTYLSEIVVKTN